MCLSVFLPKCFRMAKLKRTEKIQIQTFLASNVPIVLLWPLLPGLWLTCALKNDSHSFWTAPTTAQLVYHMHPTGNPWNVVAGDSWVCLWLVCISCSPSACTEGEVTSQSAWKGHWDWWKDEYRTHTRIPNLRLKHFVLQKQFNILCPEEKFKRSLPGSWNHEGYALWNKGRGLPLSCY